MTFEDMLREINTLSVEQRRQLVLAIFDSLTAAPASVSPTNNTREMLAAFEQLGKADTPADTDSLRSAWIEQK